MSSVAESGLRFAGYAALFDLPDGIRDIIRKGAFAKTLRERAVPLPLFWQHNPDQQIGSVEHIAEDRRGLRVIAQIDNPNGRAAKALRSRMADGLSFGFRATRFRRADGARELDEVDLFEVSLVTHPLQHHARVHLIA